MWKYHARLGPISFWTFHSGQVKQNYLLVLGQVNKVNEILYILNLKKLTVVLSDKPDLDTMTQIWQNKMQHYNTNYKVIQTYCGQALLILCINGKLDYE